MKRRSLVKAALAGASTLAAPAYLRAQSNKKLSILTWNRYGKDLMLAIRSLRLSECSRRFYGTLCGTVIKQ